MREIKFRIFDKIIPANGTEKELENPSGAIVSNWDYILNSSYLIEGLQGKYPIMQYTGLKDKNGKEIYEGDIVKTEQAIYQDISVIVWEYVEFKLKSVRELPQSSLKRFEYGYIGPILKYFKFEIIGNIFENPELLQG